MKHIKYTAAVFLLLLALISSSRSQASSWSITTVDSGSWFDLSYGSESAVVDSTGRIHLFYVGDALYHATSNADGTWTHEVIAGVGGIATTATIAQSSVSAAIDSSGAFHVSFYDDANNDLHYATNSSGSWIEQTVDATAGSGSPSAIAVDSTGHAHIAYYASTGSAVMYATNTSGAWQSETVQSANNVGTYLDVAVDSSNAIHILYYNATSITLNHVFKSSTTWSAPVAVDTLTNVGKYVSLVYSTEQNLLLASYYDSGSSQLRFAYGSTTGTWVASTVESSYAGKETAITTLADGRVAIAYQDANGTNPEGRTLRLALGTYDGSSAFSWNTTLIGNVSAATDDAGFDPTVVANSSGDIAVLYKYHHDDELDQIYAYGQGSYASLVTPVDTVHFLGRNPSLVLGEENDAARSGMFISYEDFVNSDLKLATFDATAQTWSSTVLDDNDTLNKEIVSSLSINPATLLHTEGLLSVGYTSAYDLFFNSESAVGTWGTKQDLGIAGNDFTVVDNQVDAAGGMHMIYAYDPIAVGDAGLYYTTQSTSSWGGELIYTSAYAPTNAILLLDAAGNPYVIYRNATPALVLATRNSDGTWTSTEIVTGSNLYHPAAALLTAPTGEVTIHLAYYDSGTYQIMYGVYQSGAWTLSTALTSQFGRGSANDNAPMISLALDTPHNGNIPHITYHDGLTGTLKHAWLESGTWQTETIDDTGGVTGTSSKLKIDSTGKLHVAYFSLAHFDLRYATNMECGDGVISFGETCDDGNAVSGDGCTVTCAYEDVCGDNRRSGDEQCDDGNDVDDDECHNNCTANLDWIDTESSATASSGGCNLNHGVAPHGDQSIALLLMMAALSALLVVKKRSV